MLTLRFRRDGPADALLLPLVWGAVIGIAVNSARRALSKQGTPGRAASTSAPDAVAAIPSPTPVL